MNSDYKATWGWYTEPYEIIFQDFESYNFTL